MCCQAELRPSEAGSADSSQTDEEDMGMTYAELGVFGYLRKVLRCGPVKMFLRLTEMWKALSPQEVSVKVKSFYLRLVSLPSLFIAGQALLLLLLGQPPQAHHAHAFLPRGGLLPGR